jgi:hypothetical protein
MKKIVLAIISIAILLNISTITALAAEPTTSNLMYFDSVSAPVEGMAVVNTNNKYGYMNSKGELAISLNYDNAEDFKEGLAAVSTGGQWDEDTSEYIDGKWGFIDKTGKIVIPLIYDKVCSFSEGLAAVAKDGKLGFIDKTGKAVIALNYNNYTMFENYAFSEGYTCVPVSGDIDSPVFNIISTSGSIPFEFNYDCAKSYSEGMLAVANNGWWGIADPVYPCRSYNEGKWGFIDVRGNEIIPLIYDYVSNFNEGIAVVSKDGRYGAINNQGNVVVPIIYEDISSSASEGVLCVCADGKWGYVDLTGQAITSTIFDFCCFFREGLAVNAQGGKWGAIDKNGKTVIPFTYDNMWNFSEGLARVRVVKGGKWGFLDTNGNIVIEPVYQAASDFVDGTAFVKKDNKFGVISKTSIPYSAKPTSSSVLVNGNKVAFDAYNINGNNYIKLRDLAMALNGSDKQFEVAWDSINNAISLKSGNPYTKVGGELVTTGSTNIKAATITSSTVYIDGVQANLTAYNIGGNNYFKLRDIGKALNFSVTWDGTANTISIDTSIGYVMG